MSASESTLLRSIELGLGLLLCAAFLGFRDLPLVDLPQHVLQLANWLRIERGDVTVRELELNFETPYLLAYPVARVLASWVSVLTALKLVLVASLVLQAMTLRRLARLLGHDPWLGLLAFPLGLGFSFCFGFVSFCAAVPLIYWCIELMVRHREAASLRSGLALAAVLSTLLVAHGAAFGFAVGVLGPLLLGGRGRLWQRVAPLSVPVLLALAWLAPGGTSTRLGDTVWRIELGRVRELPAQLVGFSSVDAVSLFGGIAVVSLVLLSLGRRRSLSHVAPLTLALLGYFVFPTLFRGVGYLAPRFAVFIVPGLLLAFQARPAPAWQAPWLKPSANALVALLLTLTFAVRLHSFNRETAEFHELTRELPPGQRIRPLVFERTGHAFPSLPAHLHVPAYYSVEKGGDPGYSFAAYSTSVVRYRPGYAGKLTRGEEWVPQAFDAAREAAEYDYFLVRSAVDRTRELFGESEPAASLERRVGSWWAYRRTSTAVRGARACLRRVQRDHGMP